MSGEAKRVGDWGEALTAEYLRGLGWHILESGFACPEGEIDLIAQKGDTLAFVEVKTRQSAHYGAGREAVTCGNSGKSPPPLSATWHSTRNYPAKSASTWRS